MGAESPAAAFARLSNELSNEPTEGTTLLLVVQRASEFIPAVDACSVTVRRRRHRLETLVSSSELASRCDQLQYELGEGPSVETVTQEDCYLVEDLSLDERWPRWTPRAAAMGMGSMLTVRLSVDEQPIGALNLYAHRPHAFTHDDVDLAMIYSTHAANALHSARTVTGLRTAQHSRHMIGVAQGILMARFGLDLDQSFKLLERYASESNTKLRELAEQVVSLGDLPARSDLGRR